MPIFYDCSAISTSRLLCIRLIIINRVFACECECHKETVKDELREEKKVWKYGRKVDDVRSKDTQ